MGPFSAIFRQIVAVVLAVCPYVVGVAELYVSEGGVYLFELFPELR